MASSAHILMVDDDPALLRSLRAGLGPGYTVRAAGTGEAALVTLARDPVDLVFLGDHLPDGPGIPLLRQIKERYPQVLVFLMTAAGSEALVVACFDSGGRKYLRKLFAIATLLERVGAYLAARRHSREARRPVLEGRDGAPGPGENEPRDPRIARAIAYIESHLPAPVRVRDVARVAGLSKSRFSQAFKQATGFPVKPFILRRQMAQGIARLFDLRLSIKEVAALVGINHPGNFARAFQQLTGYTPSEFRASLRAKLAPRR